MNVIIHSSLSPYLSGFENSYVKFNIFITEIQTDEIDRTGTFIRKFSLCYPYRASVDYEDTLRTIMFYATPRRLTE